MNILLFQSSFFLFQLQQDFEDTDKPKFNKMEW